MTIDYDTLADEVAEALERSAIWYFPCRRTMRAFRQGPDVCCQTNAGRKGWIACE